MGMTMTQKILAKHAGLDSVKAGDLIEADLDLVLGNDITSPVAIKELAKFKNKEVFNKDKFLTTLFLIKILSLQSIVKWFASLPRQMILLIISK